MYRLLLLVGICLGEMVEQGSNLCSHELKQDDKSAEERELCVTCSVWAAGTWLESSARLCPPAHPAQWRPEVPDRWLCERVPYEMTVSF